MTLPDPMTAPDCDLRDFPYMPLDVLRLRDSGAAALADPEAFRACVLAWCASWHQVPAASLPDDDAALSVLLGYGRTVTAWRKVRKAGGLHGWVKCSDGRLYHPVVADKAREAWSRKEAQRERSRKGNQARWGSRGDGQSESLKDNPVIPKGQSDDPQRKVLPIPTDPKGKEKEKEKEEREDAEAAPLTAAPSEPPSAVDLLWQQGLPILAHLTGKPPAACRGLLGQLRKNIRDDCPRLLLVLQEAREMRPSDPVAWLTAATSARAGPGSARNSDEAVLRAAGLWPDPSPASPQPSRQGLLQ